MCAVPCMTRYSSQACSPVKGVNAPYLAVIVKPRHDVEATTGCFNIALSIFAFRQAPSLSRSYREYALSNRLCLEIGRSRRIPRMTA